MYRLLSSASLIGLIAAIGLAAQAPAPPPAGFPAVAEDGGRRGARVSTRDPHTDGYVTAKEVTDGDVPSAVRLTATSLSDKRTIRQWR